MNDTIKVYDPIRNIQKILVNTGAGSQPRAVTVDPSTRYVCSQFNIKACKFENVDVENSTVCVCLRVPIYQI